MRDGVPEILIACAKIPVGSSISDNFSNGSTGNLLAAVDLASGTLSTAYGSRKRGWPVLTSKETHPDTGGLIRGFNLPYWDEVKQVALRAQKSLPGFRSIGWDIAITDEGPLLVEANAGYGIASLQIAHQRGLRSEITQKLT